MKDWLEAQVRLKSYCTNIPTPLKVRCLIPFHLELDIKEVLCAGSSAVCFMHAFALYAYLVIMKGRPVALLYIVYYTKL
jgi:hypothetical protein